MGSPAGGVDFDRNRLSQGELIYGIAGIVLLVDLWFDWYGVNVTAGSGVLKGFTVGASADAWHSFTFIDIILFLVALIAIGAAVMRATNNVIALPWPPAVIVTVAGAAAVLLILFRIIDTPVDTNGVEGIDVSRKIGIWLGLLAAAAVAYGGWRAMQESDVSFGDLGRGSAGAAGDTAAGGDAAAPTSAASTAQMPTEGSVGVPGGGAADVAPGEEGPGAPHPGTSTGAPAEEREAPPPAAPDADPVPGETGGQTPPGLAGEPRPGRGTEPPGV